MKNINQKLIIGIAVLAFVGINSCKKKKNSNPTDITARDNNQADMLYSGLYSMVTQYASENKDSLERTAQIETPYSNQCNSITVTFTSNGGNYPKTMTIDFGPTDCMCNDGKQRRGKVMAVFTGPYEQMGTKITITPENYYVNDWGISGTKVVTNNGPDSVGTSFSIQVNGVVTAPNNAYHITWNSTRTRKWVAGENTGFFTPDSSGIMGIAGLTDDAYDITGNASGVDSQGRHYTVSITTPLHWQYCGYLGEITSGKLTIVPQGYSTCYVDFGNGACDQAASVKIDSYTFNLYW